MSQLYALLTTADDDNGPFGAQFLGLFDSVEAAYDQVVGPEYLKLRRAWLAAADHAERTSLWRPDSIVAKKAEWSAPVLEQTVDDQGRISWGKFGYWLEPVQINTPYIWKGE